MTVVSPRARRLDSRATIDPPVFIPGRRPTVCICPIPKPGYGYSDEHRICVTCARPLDDPS